MQTCVAEAKNICTKGQ